MRLRGYVHLLQAAGERNAKRTRSCGRVLSGYYTFGRYDILRVGMCKGSTTLSRHSSRFSCRRTLVRAVIPSWNTITNTDARFHTYRLRPRRLRSRVTPSSRSHRHRSGLILVLITVARRDTGQLYQPAAWHSAERKTNARSCWPDRWYVLHQTWLSFTSLMTHRGQHHYPRI